MITKLRLVNFQCHKNREIELAPVTSIVGASDRGKSAVVRALRWALTNSPNGSSFIKHGATRCRVDVTFDCGTVLSRQRGKSLNQYVIKAEAGKQTYKAFGSTLPQDVATLANIEDDINIQQQHNSYFWLTLKSTQVTRELNAIVALDEIDRVVDNIRKGLSRSKADQRVCAEILAGEVAELDEYYKPAPSIEREWRVIQELQVEQLSLAKHIEALEDIVREIEALQEHKSELEFESAILQLSCNEIHRLELKANRLERECGNLSRLMDSITQSQALFEKLSSNATKLRSAWNSLQTEKCPLCQK